MRSGPRSLQSSKLSGSWTDFVRCSCSLTSGLRVCGDDFLRACPELVVVDEAHTCAWAGEGRGSRHQRHQLVSGLAADPRRHLILVTATPHSGKEAAFRALLTLLDPDFANLPDDLSGPANEPHRRRLAAHFVQRRRGDIRHYLQADTPFPEREEAEEAYKLSADYKRLFQDVLDYARETVADPTGGSGQRQRVRWWSALALLRSMASSPAAAAATLRTRAATADTDTAEEADAIGRRTVLDLVEEDAGEAMDVAPGSDPGEDADEAGPLPGRAGRLHLPAQGLRRFTWRPAPPTTSRLYARKVPSSRPTCFSGSPPVKHRWPACRRRPTT